jgi:hypothetical protein
LHQEAFSATNERILKQKTSILALRNKAINLLKELPHRESLPETKPDPIRAFQVPKGQVLELPETRHTDAVGRP